MEKAPHEHGISDPLVQTDFTLVSVFVRFAGATPTLEEIVATRELDDRLRAMPISNVKNLLQGKSEYLLGVWPRPRAFLVMERAAQLKLSTVEQAAGA
jgi:hypothetical protein